MEKTAAFGLMRKGGATMIVDERLQREIEQFLYYEAELLDNYRYDEWLALMTKTIRYAMPVRLTKEEGDPGLSEMYHFLEDYETLQLRVERLKTNFAWAEDPPSRTRRMISNVRIKEKINDHHVKVHHYFMLYRNRGEEANYELISGERRDTLIKVNGRWMIDDRLILVDQAKLGLKNLAVFF
jgi:3-phenylpropionate/cinnamic acid dioxygenase small subunit